MRFINECKWFFKLIDDMLFKVLYKEKYINFRDEFFKYIGFWIRKLVSYEIVSFFIDGNFN